MGQRVCQRLISTNPNPFALSFITILQDIKRLLFKTCAHFCVLIFTVDCVWQNSQRELI